MGFQFGRDLLQDLEVLEIIVIPSMFLCGGSLSVSALLPLTNRQVGLQRSRALSAM